MFLSKWTRQPVMGKSMLMKRTMNQWYSTKPVPPPKTFTWKSASVLGVTAIGLGFYFDNEKKKYDLERNKRLRAQEKKQRAGHAVGRPFELFNVNEGKVTSSESVMKGKFSLIYFGFTHCPDICPEELDKMASVVDEVKKEFGKDVLIPIFITCDPLRDTADVVKAYVQDFHPDLIGFTGSPEELKSVARAFRVYTFTPPDVKATDDYLVDHSIFFYLMDPEGNFVDCYARDTTPEEVLASFKNYRQDYLDDHELKKV
ncbi:SCO1/SenC-domain-containing protein [Mucor mucedo]|uniref:SCO1/SenC-domain-containing protein n=1 Tax=Mucor mucedo TaxID=29922 RepID=UPI00221F2702|nr:SCO1/SenC-domain-containing protein [Mucor mucedo]KAI7895901.1 SCO1/SenC-domain-containing protein [Mucor mucedo]